MSYRSVLSIAVFQTLLCLLLHYLMQEKEAYLLELVCICFSLVSPIKVSDIRISKLITA